MKHVAIIGSTGSIGTQTLEIARWNQDIKICALSAGRNIDLLEKQAREFRPEIVGLWDEKLADELKDRLKDMDIRVVSGMDGLIEIAEYKTSDILVTAIVGMIGIRPTVAAIKAGKDIALANKETLVTAGHIIMPLAKEKGVSILPVDSEHSAIFQSLQGNKHDSIEKILLTASGGPFYGFQKEQLQYVTLQDALKHPNWSMGHKITIDSATLMNKGLEFIEAKWLFDVTPDQIEILVHRQSVLHSAVEYQDYAVIGQMGVPDMKIPIQYALLYPERFPCPTKPLSLTEYGTLTFEKPDYETFSCLKTAIQAIRLGGAYPCRVNSANEEAVAAFLNGQISFLEISELVQSVLQEFSPSEIHTYEDVVRADQQTRAFIRSQIQAKKG